MPNPALDQRIERAMRRAACTFLAASSLPAMVTALVLGLAPAAGSADTVDYGSSSVRFNPAATLDNLRVWDDGCGTFTRIEVTANDRF